MTVFVDTSAFYAVLDRSDEHHAIAHAVWLKTIDAGADLVTTNYTIMETAAIVQRRLGMAALRTFHEDIVPLLGIDLITPEQHNAAFQAVMAASRRKLSLVDCVSFDCARRLSIKSAFSFDAHFRAQGLRLLSGRDVNYLN